MREKEERTEFGIINVRPGSVVIEVAEGIVKKIELKDEFYEERDLGLYTGELREYFEGKRKVFDFKIAPSLTPFSEKVYRELGKIKYGEYRTYGDLSYEMDSSYRFARAVGNVLSKNELLIVIPCHRIVSKNGFSGYRAGIEWKKYLWEIEGMDYSRFI